MITFLMLLLTVVVTPLLYPFMPEQRIFLGYLFVAFLPAAYAAWRKEGWNFDKIWEFCFPKALWTHPSNIIDIKFFLINTALFTTLLAPFFGGVTFSMTHTYALLDMLFGSPQEQQPITLLAVILVTFGLALLSDFAIFLAHYLQHKVPFLWEFHKVHHSAQVLTPITVYRMHPVDDMLAYFLGGLFIGTGLGAAQYCLNGDPSIISVAGMNLVFFVFYVMFYNLRHSHFWLHYPGAWGEIFVSPAMHQIHHSSEKRHWDKNMGFIFSFWDAMFGTLYNPVEKEEFALGIGPETAEYDSVAALYLLPFRKNWKRLQRRFHAPVVRDPAMADPAASAGGEE